MIDTAKGLFQTFIGTAEDRIKNPFVGSFMTSWILFNWKALIILIFSSNTIETKISIIETNYNNPNDLFWIPLCIALFYVIILPYIMLGLDYLLNFSVVTRIHFNIKKDLQNNEYALATAKGEIDLEEKKTELREKKGKNLQIQAMASLIAKLEETNFSNLKMIENLKEESLTKMEAANSEFAEVTIKNNNLTEEIIRLKMINLSNEQVIKTMKKLSFPDSPNLLRNSSTDGSEPKDDKLFDS